MDQAAYNNIIRIFSPGYEVVVAQHPVLQHLANPFFKKILRFTDQVIFILNHSTFEFLFVSDNCLQVSGYSSRQFMESGVRLTFEHLHPEDMKLLNEFVYPEYYRCMDSVSDEQKLRVKSTFVVRLRKPDGTYVKFLQQNIPLTIENGKVILGLIVGTDVTDYKSDDQVVYRNVLIEASKTTVLSEGLAPSAKKLSDREIAILRMIAEGQEEKSIAADLGLSIYTVKSHKKNMMQKVKVKNAAELVRYGMANLLI